MNEIGRKNMKELKLWLTQTECTILQSVRILSITWLLHVSASSHSSGKLDISFILTFRNM